MYLLLCISRLYLVGALAQGTQITMYNNVGNWETLNLIYKAQKFLYLRLNFLRFFVRNSGVVSFANDRWASWWNEVNLFLGLLSKIS